MIKKLISLALVGIMSISMLTGCDVNDLGYLNYSKELSNITEYSFENNTQIEVSKEIAGEAYNVDLELTGEVNLEDLESMYMSFDLLFKVNDVGIEKPINFKIVDNKLYVSKASLLEVVALEKAISGTHDSEKVMKELYNNDLKDVEYILLTDLGEVYNDMSYKEMSDNAVDYYITAFKTFDSKLITKTSKGYSLELTSESALDFINNLVTYISENKALVFDETVKYVENLYSNIEMEGLTGEDKEVIFKEIRDSRQDFYDFVDQAVLVLASGEFDSYVDMVKGSKIKQEIYKEGNTYKEIAEAEIVVEEVKMGKFVSNTTITPKKIEKAVITGGSIAIEEVEKLYNNVENRINPVQKLELEWFSEDPEAIVTATRLEGGTDFDFQPYTIIDGSIYLPLRYIGESFGEEVAWDDATKTAYVIRGEEKFNMTGIIVDSNTMIKVRDFEKLGYTVDFVQNDGSSIATISK